MPKIRNLDDAIKQIELDFQFLFDDGFRMVKVLTNYPLEIGLSSLLHLRVLFALLRIRIIFQ
jgi:hypothetical protein